MPTDCVFCKIRDGEMPAMRVYEDERTLAIMDINPVNSGHCLVISKAHAPTLWDADPVDLQAAITAAQKVAVALKTVVKPDGLNMLQANGAAAFQSVAHYHLHLIPRWNNDGKGFDWSLVPGDRGQIQAIGERLREAIG
jgi:histidine triad (HIT) family protein